MNFARLLLDPRGEIGRGAFWTGLGLLSAILLLVLNLAIPLSALGPVDDLLMAAGPVMGTSYLTAQIVAAVLEGRAPLDRIPVVVLTCARLYPLVCLCLKRQRDAGRGPAGLIIVSVLSLAFHVCMGRWAYDIWASEIGTLAAPLLDFVVGGLMWTVFLIWTGSRPSRSRPTA